MCAIISLTEIFMLNLCKDLYPERGNKEGCFGLEVSDLSVYTTKKCFLFFQNRVETTHSRFEDCLYKASYESQFNILD